jgi:uncharacterized protein (TIGR03437 family)
MALAYDAQAQAQPGNGLILSDQQLAFAAFAGGDAPSPQAFSVSAQDITEALPYTIRLDGGTTGSAAPAWLSVYPLQGNTPARIQVSVDQAGLAAGDYSARVTVSSGGGSDLAVSVALRVDDTIPDTALDLSPQFLRFNLLASSGQLRQTVLVRSAPGEGPVSFQVSVPDNTPWLSASPTSGRTAPNQPFPVTVSVDPALLPAPTASGVVRLGLQDVPVTVLTEATGPVMGLNFNGLRFDVRQDNGNSDVRNVLVLNLGDGNVNWQAEAIVGKDLVNLNPNQGQSAAGGFSRLGVAVTPAGLQPGTYYALLQVSDPLAASSPQYVTIVLNVTSATTASPLDPSPQGLFFVGESGATPTASQPVRLFVSSATPIAFQASASTVDGADWLAVAPTKGVTSTQSTAQLAVVADPTNLAPGIYTGDVTVALASREIRTTNITIVVPNRTAGVVPPATASTIGPPAAGTCAPSKLSLTQTGLINSFAARAGWPVPLIVRLANDCGDPVLDASVVASFSNADPPVSMPLTNSQVGLYSATWSPRNALASTSVTVRATAQGLDSASSVVIGAVTTNPLPPPVLFSNGVLDSFNPVAGSPLAPGSMARAYGTDLAAGSLPAPAVPLTTSLGETSLLIGGYEAPLYFISPGRVDVQIPVELESDRRHAVIISANGQYSVSDSLTLAPAQPGLLAGDDGQIVARHADLTLVSDRQPAQASETIVAYLSGMGATDPPIASGYASSRDVLATVQIVPTVTIDGKNAPLVFAGLSPGLVGVYEVQVKIPSGITEGRVPMVVTQNGVASNVAMLPVAE